MGEGNWLRWTGSELVIPYIVMLGVRVNIASVHYFAVVWCVCLSCISCDSYCIRLIVAHTYCISPIRLFLIVGIGGGSGLVRPLASVTTGRNIWWQRWDWLFGQSDDYEPSYLAS